MSLYTIIMLVSVRDMYTVSPNKLSLLKKIEESGCLKNIK